MSNTEPPAFAEVQRQAWTLCRRQVPFFLFILLTTAGIGLAQSVAVGKSDGGLPSFEEYQEALPPLLPVETFEDAERLLESASRRLPVYSLAWRDKEEREIVSLSQRGLHVWDLDTRGEVARFRLDIEALPQASLVVEADMAAFPLAGSRIAVFDLVEAKYRGFVRGVVAAYAPGGNVLAAGTRSGKINLYSGPDYEEEDTVRDKAGAGITALAWGDDSTLAVGTGSGSVLLLDLQARKEKCAFSDRHALEVVSVEWSSRGKLASSSQDGRVIIWDAESCRELFEIDTGAPPKRGEDGTAVDLDVTISSLSWSPDGFYLAGGGNDHRVYVWDVERSDRSPSREILSMEGHTKRINAILWSKKGRHLASGSADGTIRLWSFETLDTVLEIEGHARPVTAVSLGGRGQLAAASGDRIHIWNVESGREVGRIDTSPHFVSALAFSPNGERLAIGYRNHESIHVWDVEGKYVVRKGKSPSRNVHALAWSGDGRRLAGVAQGRAAFSIWLVDPIDADSPVGSESLMGLGGSYVDLRAVVWSSKDGEFAAISETGTHYAISVNGRLQEKPTVREAVKGEPLALSGSAKYLVARGDEGGGSKVEEWDLSGNALPASRTFSAKVTSAAFSPDETLRALGFANGLVHVYAELDGRGPASRSFLGGDRGMWATCRGEYCQRHDDGTLLLEYRPSGELVPRVPVSRATMKLSERIEIKDRTGRIEFEEGGAVKIRFKIQNNSNRPLFWLRLSRVEGQGREDGLLFLSETLSALEGNSEAELTGVLVVDNYERLEGRPEKSLEIEIRALNETVPLGAIDVHVDYGVLKLGEVRWDPKESHIEVELLNVGTKGLENVLVDMKMEGYERWMTSPYVDIPARGVVTLFIFFQEERESGVSLRESKVTVVASADRGTEYGRYVRKWMFTDQRILVEEGLGLVAWAAILLALSQLATLVFLYSNFLAFRIFVWPPNISKSPINNLEHIVTRLREFEFDKHVLYFARIDVELLEPAMNFPRREFEEERCVLLAEHLGLSYEKDEEEGGSRIKVALGEELPSGDDYVWICLRGHREDLGDLEDGVIESYLVDLPNDGLSVILWRSPDWHDKQPAPEVDQDKLFIPTGRQLTQLLLSSEPKPLFIDMISGHLAARR